MVDQVINEQSPIAYDPTLVVPVQQPGNNLQTFTVPVGDIAAAGEVSSPVAETIFVDTAGTLITNEDQYIAAHDEYIDTLVSRKMQGVSTLSESRAKDKVIKGFLKNGVNKRLDHRLDLPFQCPQKVAAKLLAADGGDRNPYPTIETGFAATTSDNQVVRCRGGSSFLMTSTVSPAFTGVKLSCNDSLIFGPNSAPAFIGIDGVSFVEFNFRGIIGIDELSPIFITESPVFVINFQFLSVSSSTESPIKSIDGTEFRVNGQQAFGPAGNFLFDVEPATGVIVEGGISSIDGIGVVDTSISPNNSSTVVGFFNGKRYGFDENNVVWVLDGEGDAKGSDLNDGRTKEFPVLTIPYAVSLAQQRFPSGWIIREAGTSTITTQPISPSIPTQGVMCFDFPTSHILDDGAGILDIPDILSRVFIKTKRVSSESATPTSTFVFRRAGSATASSERSTFLSVESITITGPNPGKNLIESSRSWNLDVGDIHEIQENPGALFVDTELALNSNQLPRFTGRIGGLFNTASSIINVPIYSGVNPSAVSCKIGSREYNGYYDITDENLSPIFWDMGKNLNAVIALTDIPGDTRIIGNLSVSGLFHGQKNTINITQAASPNNNQDIFFEDSFIPFDGIDYVTSKEDGAVDKIDFFYDDTVSKVFYRVTSKKQSGSKYYTHTVNSVEASTNLVIMTQSASSVTPAGAVVLVHGLNGSTVFPGETFLSITSSGVDTNLQFEPSFLLNEGDLITMQEGVSA